tara:strand:+ start:1301 stop:1486 length:186 start_codon:yes stop_codon:yes gene_type:complete
MTTQELKYVEKSLENLGCPVSQSVMYALQIIGDLEKSKTDIMATTFALDSEGVLIISTNQK